ncbi:MAG: DUF58 domain-containing protein [Opitutaceae bacterium]|nr:DUF58 domain-containing protein [Opitutaceae bacterium]|tara:strand:+ start:5525 stop:6442 length:918 start_codon:yes stop_codon:yes gene_type:complete
MKDPREILKKVRQIEIRTRKMVTDAMAGHYNSVFKGQGMDFEEVREYTPGDDIRAIDWNVTAKMAHPFVKRFREERELTLMLVVDVSASGDFGSIAESKRELMAEMASVLAFSAIRNNDKVGLLLFTDQIEAFIPPQKGKQHVLRIIRELLFFEPESTGTDIKMALDYLNRIVKRKAVTFLISDFLVRDTFRRARIRNQYTDMYRSLTLTDRRHDLIVLRLSDPHEYALPNLGILSLEDAETGQLIELDTRNSQIREEFQNQNGQQLEDFKRTLKRLGIDSIYVENGQPYITKIREFFLNREKRR